jgi:hypothetical protein
MSELLSEETSSSSFRPCTEKLNDTNFSMWPYDILKSLGHYNLDGFIREHTTTRKSASTATS